MDLGLDKISGKLGPLVQSSKHYMVFAFLILFCCLYGFLIFRINSLARSEPTDEQVAEKLQKSTRPRIDEEAVSKIQQLEEQNVQIKSIFEEARQNPFAE